MRSNWYSYIVIPILTYTAEPLETIYIPCWAWKRNGKMYRYFSLTFFNRLIFHFTKFLLLYVSFIWMYVAKICSQMYLYFPFFVICSVGRSFAVVQ